MGPCSWVCTCTLHTAVLKVLMGVLSTDTLLYNHISSFYLLKTDYLEKTLLLDFCGSLLLGLHRYTPHSSNQSVNGGPLYRCFTLQPYQFFLSTDYLEKTLLLDFCGSLLLGLHRYTPHSSTQSVNGGPLYR